MEYYQRTFIKIDVESAELEAIEVFMGTISSKNKPILFVEILRKWFEKYRYDTNHLFQAILTNDYDAYAYCPDYRIDLIGSITDITLQTKFLFIPTRFDTNEIIKEILSNKTYPHIRQVE